MEHPLARVITCPILVGRELPLQALLQMFEQAQHGQGHVALITGEAGIGKSRLVRELKNRLQLSALNCVQGNCFEVDRTLPYTPITDMLRGIFITAPEVRQRLH